MALHFDYALRLRSNSVKTPGLYGYAGVVVHRSASLASMYSFHAGQTRLTVSSTHSEAVKVEQCYRRIAAFFKELWATAEQFNAQQRWCRILSLALVKYLRGRQLHPPDCLPAPA
ncbi:MAG: hypothetical protein FJ190_07280 [Gammaproteobacteria bacterium]|nr:hypothetical protein [Gammaproteobacteria bacterium]